MALAVQQYILGLQVCTDARQAHELVGGRAARQATKQACGQAIKQACGQAIKQACRQACT